MADASADLQCANNCGPQNIWIRSEGKWIIDELVFPQACVKLHSANQASVDGNHQHVLGHISSTFLKKYPTNVLFMYVPKEN